MKTALLIIDVQNDYFPNGRMELYKAVEALDKIKDLTEHFRSLSMPVVYIKHVSVRPGATFFLPDTTGVEIHDAIKPVDDEQVIIKYFPNSFRNTELDAYLRKNDISKLMVAGMMTHMCIDATVRAAFDLGYECIVVGDCCATKDLKIDNKEVSAENVHNAFLAALNGIFAKVINGAEAMKMNLGNSHNKS